MFDYPTGLRTRIRRSRLIYHVLPDESKILNGQRPPIDHLRGCGIINETSRSHINHISPDNHIQTQTNITYTPYQHPNVQNTTIQTQTQTPTTYLYPNSFITTLLNKLTLLTSPHWSPRDQIFKSWYHWFEHNFGQLAGTDPNIYEIYILTDYDHRRGTVEFVHGVTYIEEHLMRELGFRDDDGENWCLARAVAGRGDDGTDGISMVQPCTRAFVTKLAIEYAERLEWENLYALWECILEKEMVREAEEEERLWNNWLDWIDIMLRHGVNRNGFYRNIEMEIMWFLECRWTDRMGGFVREAMWEGIRRWTFDVELVGWILLTLNGR